MIWPILATMPYGWSYFQEIKSGISNQYLLRSTRAKYFIGKYFAVFISGGFTVAVPVLLNLLLNALVCPAKPLEITGLLSLVHDGMFLSELYYSHPWWFCLIWCVIEFFIGGSTATLAFFAGCRMRFIVSVMLTPFVLCYFMAIIGETIQKFNSTYLLLNPLKLAMATPLNNNPEWLVFSMIGIFSITAFLAGYLQVKNHELS